jgi:hypothetical protein
VVLLVGLLALGKLTATVESSPTTNLVITILNSRSGVHAHYISVLLALACACVAGYLGGLRTCAWALRRPGDAASRIDTAHVSRRPAHRTVRATVLSIDRASVWRSASLRRGLLVLAVLPGLVAAAAKLEWSSLVLLPGLVAAGAGLLFGVNVFCLDGSGIVWLASLPARPGVAFWSKAQVIAETCLVAIVLTLACGVLRTGRTPTATEAVALGASGLIAMLRVLALCLELSIRHPHRADLRGPRDTPAPPGVMAAYSARLALSTTMIAVIFSALAQAGAWQWPAAVALPFLLLSIRRLLAAAREWDEPFTRARVVTTVASG